jgi:hypothetical protein
MPEGMLAFAALSVVVAVTPGPDSLLVVQHTLRRGRREGVRVAAGAGAGSLAWGIGSALGLSAILAASAQLYRGVQLAGAGYLVFLGFQGWRATHLPEPAKASAPGLPTRRMTGVHHSGQGTGHDRAWHRSGDGAPGGDAPRRHHLLHGSARPRRRGQLRPGGGLGEGRRPCSSRRHQPVQPPAAPGRGAGSGTFAWPMLSS